jgi:hypothetical protein
MKKFSKSVMLFVSVVAVSAFVVPAMASAATWTGSIPSTHVFDSPNPANRLLFNSSLGAGSTCAVARFHIDVRSSTDAVVTGTNFQNCMGTGLAVNCTATATGSNFPWTVTNPATDNIQIHGVHVTVLFENTPGNATACALPAPVTVTGTLSGGQWTNAGHEIEFLDDAGLHVTSPLGPGTVTISGTLADTQRTTTMIDTP